MELDLNNLPNDAAFLKQIIRDLYAKVVALEQEVKNRRRREFGRSSEKLGVARFAVDNKEPSGGKKNGHGRRKLPDDLPREDVEIDVPEDGKKCDKCGHALEHIGEEISEILDYRPASFFVKRIRRLKYACKNCEDTVLTAEMPPRPIEKGMPGEGLLAHVLVSKYADHLPLNRLESVFERHGIDISRSTMCDWVRDSAKLLEPICNAMKREALKSKKVHSDDTPVPVQDGEKGRTKTGRLWVYTGDAAHPHDLFDYTPDRKGERPKNFLGEFEGYLQADAYAGYEDVYRTGKVIEVACWAHTRRKFFEAQDTDAANSAAAIEFIGKLYETEREAKNLDAKFRRALRETKSRTVLDEFKKWLDEHSKILLPKSPMGQAMAYTLSNWTALSRYIEDGDLDIDNNEAERALRCVAIGRKNWLFAGSDEGGRRAAIIYSLISTCKRHGVNPFEYLRDVIERVSTHPASRIDELLPHRWKELRAAAAKSASNTS